MRYVKRWVAVFTAVILLFNLCSCDYRDLLGDEMTDQVERETGIDIDYIDYQNRRAVEEMKRGFKLLGGMLWDGIKQGYRELDIAFGAKYDDMMEIEPEIKTEKRIIELKSNDFETYMADLERADRDALPIASNAFILNANGESEYRGYMIVEKKVIATKTIQVEVPTGEMGAIGQPSPTKMKEYEVPWKIEYTLHKHEVENKMTASAVGRFLSGIVGLQWVHTQSCACGYESVITWDLPLDDDLLDLPSASVDAPPAEYKHPALKKKK